MFKITCAIFTPSGYMLPNPSRTWFAIVPARVRPAPGVRVSLCVTLAHAEF